MPRRIIALLAIVASCACASVERRSFASRFVQEGSPAVDLGGPRPATLPGRRAKSARTITTNVSRIVGGSFESTNPKLRGALTHLTIAPTIEQHLAVSRAYRESGIMDHALDYLNRSLAVNGPSATTYEARARLWRDWGYPQLGLTDAHRAVYLAPDSPTAHNTLGTLLYRLGQRRAAEEQFQRTLALSPDAWYAFANLCHVSIAQGKTREAIALCQRATTLRKQQQSNRRQDNQR